MSCVRVCGCFVAVLSYKKFTIVMLCFLQVLLLSVPHAPPGAMADHNRTAPTRGLVAWISFAKVGSTTLRYHLRERALSRGWPSWPKPQCICEENFRHNVLPNRLRCQALPDGYVLATPAYGYCEKLRRRPCHYVTLLREPIARMHSAFNYYCRSCAEGACERERTALSLAAGNRSAARNDAAANSSSRRCPHLSLVEYAAREGNRYTAVLGASAFAARAAAATAATAATAAPESEPHHQQFRRAIHRLARTNASEHRHEMLVLLTERLGEAELRLLASYLGDDDSQADARGRPRRSAARGTPAVPGTSADPRHAHMHRTSFTGLRPAISSTMSASEHEALSRILRYDIALYHFARNVVRDHWPPFRTSPGGGTGGAPLAPM